MSENRSRLSSFFFSFVSVCIILSFFASVALNFLLAAAVVSSQQGQMESPDKKLQTKVRQNPNEKRQNVLLLSVEGMIIDAQPWDKDITTSQYVKERLEQAALDDSVKAVVVRLNTPGGTVHATDKIYEAILEFKKQTSKPVIAYMDSVAASGGYYIASACDYIVGSPYGITGSIGVIMSVFHAKELFENKLGIKETVFKSGPNKDLGSSMRDMTEEERQIFQSIVMEMYTRFSQVVKDGRPALAKLSEEEFNKIADGRVYTNQQALAVNLVDALGDFDVAVQKAAEEARIASKPQVIEYQSKRSFLEELMEPSVHKGELQSVKQLWGEMQSPRFYYMWK